MYFNTFEPFKIAFSNGNDWVIDFQWKNKFISLENDPQTSVVFTSLTKKNKFTKGNPINMKQTGVQ